MAAPRPLPADSAPRDELRGPGHAGPVVPPGDYLRAAFMASPAMMAITRLADGVLLDANPAFLEAAALTREQAVGRPILDLGIWVDDSRRLEYRRRLETGGRVQDFEARFRNRLGVERDMMISAEVLPIDGVLCTVVVALDISERRQREREQAALYRLSAAAVDATGLPALFRRVHEIISEVLPAKSFFIALYDRATDEVTFPLWINEIYPATPPARKLARHLTDYVILSGKPLLLTDANMQAFTRETGHTPAAYGQCQAWLGAPLLIDGRPAGAISMQDYEDPHAYRAEDVRLLNFVAEQIAAALVRYGAEEARRRNEAQQRESQEYFAKSFFSNPAAVTLADARDGRLIEVNSTFSELSGYTREEVLGRSTLEIGLWVNPERRHEFMHVLGAHGHVREFEAQFRAKHGAVRDVLITADVMEMNGRSCMLTVGLDITERRRREREQAALYRISEAARESADRAALFGRVHAVLADLMPARNFFVALLNADRTEVAFPYYADEVTPAPQQRPHARYLTDYVIESRQTLLLRHDEVESFRARTGFAPRFGWCKVWLGAPLVAGGGVIGAIAVQDYHDAQAFTPGDLAFFEFVAGQVANALRRYEADEARRRSETLRRETQEYFARSFQASPALMALATLHDGKIIDANPAFLRASGYAREEVLGRTSLDLGLWPVPEHRLEFMERLKRDGSVRNLEAVFHTKRAEARFVSLSADVFEMEGRRCMLITAIDLTDRHRREQVQAATYEISQAVLAGGDLAALFAGVHRIIGGLMAAKNFYVALLSADGRRIEFPYFADEHAPGQRVNPPSRAPGLGFTEHVMEVGQPVLVTQAELAAELTARGPYQPPAQVPLLRLGAPLRLAGRTLGVIAVHDYHDPAAFGEDDKRLLAFVADQVALAIQRQQAGEALARAEQQYRGIFENALEGLYQTTPEGRFIRANPAMARILGYETPEALLAGINDVGRQLYTEPGRRAQFLEMIRTTDRLLDFESEVFRADGSRIRLCESVHVVRDASGAATHFEGVAIDVTASHERAKALREARDAADAANRAKSHFLASMSHELRTPLNGILGYTQILRRDPALNERQRAGVGIIHQSAEHLLALINDVLDLAKIEARKLELHPVEFDLHEFVHGVADFFAPRAREKSLLLETAFPADLPRLVRGDTQRLRQVVFNLLSNAIKFTAQGGVVFSVERAGPALRFSVSDTGPGIREEDQKRLFEPFLQLGDAGQRTSGTGLGLNVSRSILEQMGAVLHVESRPGWGTRFWFEVTLPELNRPHGGSRPPLPARRYAGYAGPRLRVLAADDHAPNRTLLTDLLVPLGFEVVTACDGQEALDLARARRPDLVLLDLRMPRLDGLAAARAIRESYAANPPCLIGVSASAHEVNRQASLEAGCVEFLAKPFREEDLFELMERHLGVKWLITEAPASETGSPFPHLPHPPQPADAEMLFDLASKGDVIGVRTYAQQLAARDPRLAPFAANVTDLAARFKMKAIRQFVGRYRAGAAPAGGGEVSG
ncbi:MAG TPA: PAS domain S-box protein [Opitutaceae bacterium]|nr:PAS domain S-box protein [Opitutaceae bacterium]